MKFSERLSTLMESKGLKQSDICKATGIASSAMSYYVSGKSEPTFTNAIILASALGVTIDELAGNNELELTDDEKALIRSYRIADPRGRENILLLAEHEATREGK